MPGIIINTGEGDINMKIKNLIIKGLAGLLAAVAIVALASVPAKADEPYWDCLKGNHRYKLDFTAIQPTCTTTGCNHYFCVVCGQGLARYELPALGHKMDKGNIIVMPTATTDGFLVYRCERCGGYMGDQVIPSTGIDYPQTPQTPAPTVFDPRVPNPLAKVPMYFDTNMLAVCYIPYHSIVTINGVGVNIDAIGAQPLAPFMQAPGTYIINVTPNTNPQHSAANAKQFTVTIPSKPGKPITVK